MTDKEQALAAAAYRPAIHIDGRSMDCLVNNHREAVDL